MTRSDEKLHVADYKWNPCLVLGIPGAYVEERLPKELRYDIRTEGEYDLWDIRHAEEDWDLPCQLKSFVLVNWFGTVVVPKGSVHPDIEDDIVWFDDYVDDLSEAFVGENIGNTCAFDENPDRARSFAEKFLLDMATYESVRENIANEGETQNA